jgi:tetratricopeptide (TPR) repeat protein
LKEDPGQHIGTEELAKLLEEFRYRGETGPEPADMHPHLAVCTTCREQFEEMSVLDRQLESVESGEAGLRHGDCPETTMWREIVVGLTPPDEILVHMEHASRCDECGTLLREAVAGFADLNRELTDEERKRIGSLESAGSEWQENLAERIAGTPRLVPGRNLSPWRQKWTSVPRLGLAGVSLVGLIAVGYWVILHRNQQRTAADLLAKAYTDKRTLELRIAGAQYAPVRLSRGPGGSFTSRPTALLKAEVLIANQLESQPASPFWIEAQAEADVLEGKYDPAVEALRRALELEPHSPGILIDLATAYFQRAQQADRNDDLGAAFENLSRALMQQPDNAIALFNRAIVAEHLFLYQQAIEDWEHYLRVDGASQWAAEARTRVDALRAKLKEHQSKATPLLSPAQLAGLSSGTSPPSEVDERIEEYLREAVLSWLPEAFPEVRQNQPQADGPKRNSDSDAAQALFFGRISQRSAIGIDG